MDSAGYHQHPAHASASSSRNFPLYHDSSSSTSTSDPFDTTATMYIANNHPNQPQHHNYHQEHMFSPSHHFLGQSTSPNSSQHLPFVQVTHPTPTKAMKFRRKSIDALSISTASSFDPSPLGAMQPLPSPGTGTLDVMVEPLSHAQQVSKSRPRSPDLDFEDDDSEAERVRQAEKQARIREKGRERQRRKRERDKQAKEAKSSSGQSSHLPIPSSNQPKRTPQSLSISVPSPISPMASSLPQSASYFSMSPSHHPFSMSTGSTSVSGNSTPVTLFSPSVSTSTSGIGYSPETSMSASLFSLGLEATTLSATTIELQTDKPSKRNPRSKTRTVSTSLTTSVAAAAKKGSPPPLFSALPQPSREAKIPNPDAKPAKRRKSEPQTDDIWGMSSIVQGLGVTTGQEEPAHSTWQPKAVEARPQPRRTASDGIVMKSSHEKDKQWGARSPTPPPVPSLPSEYRQNRLLQSSSSTEIMSDAASTPSVQAEVFATRLVYLLNKDETETGWLSSQIGLDANDVEGMKGTLKAAYDKFMLEKGMKEMSLESGEGAISSHPSSTSMTPSMSLNDQRSVPASPTTVLSSSASSFFTPSTSSRSASRRGDKRPTTTAPIAESPSKPSHTRQRSLSSASMMARGLHITSHHPTQAQQHWSHPATPILLQGTSTIIPSDPQSDDTASPVHSSLQTPSTGQGSFPPSDQMTTYHGHWRSATDPTGQRVYTTFHQSPVQMQQANQNGQWQAPNTCPPGQAYNQNQNRLDSPLAIKSGQMQMLPPSSTSSNNQNMLTTSGNGLSTVGMNVHAPLQSADAVMMHGQPVEQHPGSSQGYMGHQRHFSTPVTSRNQANSTRDVMSVPYTPDTPVPVRGQNQHMMQGLMTTMPMWYHSTFMSGNQNFEQSIEADQGQQSQGHGQDQGMNAYHNMGQGGL
ncbi:uncharacterized protein IL334_001041 [Kwoniella shivajii]|uniref:Uncharacterized protein n=1 Tax=Kwoniella shivajii TaxID=564305 RepID=A0ABZ1CRX1_9TREE|nr:hypothetical protein IL334_001041 [Kwoniella shivajii]